MKPPLILKAPAKLNLSLRVLGKREDGFHEIDTLMVKVDGLSDILTFEDAPNLRFSCDDESIPADESNLVLKAVRTFENVTGLTCKVKIHLEKQIPHGAGLAGGSSDAATTMLALNQLNDSPLSPAALSAAAATIGSDIPFFLTSGSARCTGRGEIICPLSDIPPLRVLLLKPEFAVATPDAYGRWKNALPIPGISYEPVDFTWGRLVNDLELPVFQKHRFLAELKQWLLDRGLTALMSGSGSTVFAILRDSDDPREIGKLARTELDPNLWVWAGKTRGFSEDPV